MLPVEPADFVILAIGVVVSLLRSGPFVAGSDHGHALRKEQSREHVAHLLTTELENLRVFGRTFFAVVPGMIIVIAIAILFSVGLVMLLVVTDEVVKGETVVRGDEIDARIEAAPAVLIKVGATR